MILTITPKNRCMYGEGLQQFHYDDNLLLEFVNIIGLKEEIWKENIFMSHEYIKILQFRNY